MRDIDMNIDTVSMFIVKGSRGYKLGQWVQVDCIINDLNEDLRTNLNRLLNPYIYPDIVSG